MAKPKPKQIELINRLSSDEEVLERIDEVTNLLNELDQSDTIYRFKITLGNIRAQHKRIKFITEAMLLELQNIIIKVNNLYAENQGYYDARKEPKQLNEAFLDQLYHVTPYPKASEVKTTRIDF